jgi:DNA-binding SARP family transcriptional activator/CheY-like chemotaxis protein
MSTPNILVLEDDPDVRNMLEMVLTDQGYNVITAEGGELAVGLAKQQSFDLIVADIRMEGMDGLEAIRQTKESQPGIGTLVVSGYATPEDQARAHSLEVGGYLKKPFKIDEFLGLVREQLAHSQASTKLAEESDTQLDYLHWSLTTMAKLALESGATTIAWWEAAHLAGRLALAWGLDTSVAQAVEIATLLAGLKEASVNLPPALEAVFPETVHLALSHHDMEWGKLTRRESAVTSLCLKAYSGGEGEALTSEALTRENKGQWPADLLALYSNLPEDGAPEERDSGDRSRGLLALAQTLENVGDVQNARAAYLEVQQSTDSAATQVDCHLGLTRLALSQDDRASALKNASLAVRHASRRGATAHGLALLDTGWLLAQKKDPKSADILRESVRILEQTGQRAIQAQAGIALASIDPEVSSSPFLDVLFEPSHLRELSNVSHRMMDQLLVLSAASEGSARYLGRLCANFPLEVARFFPNLTEDTRSDIIRALLGLSLKTPENLLTVLLKDPSPKVRKLAAELSSQVVHSEALSPLLEVHSTGRFQIVLGGEVVPESAWKTQKVKALFAFLAFHWGKPFKGEYLSELFWPDKGEKGRRNLWWSTSMMRKTIALKDKGISVVMREGETLRLNPDIVYWHDVGEIQKYAEAGIEAEKRGDTEQVISELSKMSNIYRGPYLDGMYLDWVLERRREVDRQVERGLTSLSSILLETKQYHRALESGVRHLELEPLSQEGFYTVMAAHLGLGQPEHCAREFLRCERLLKEELDSEPTIKLLKLYQRAKMGIAESPSHLGA